MFLELLAEKAYDYARKDKRKGIAYKDLGKLSLVVWGLVDLVTFHLIFALSLFF